MSDFIFGFSENRRAKSEEMLPSCVDRVLMEIASFRDDPCLNSSLKEKIQTLETDLGFLKMFIWFLPGNCLKKSYIRATVGKGTLCIYVTRNLALHLDLAASKLLQKVELCKNKIRKDCLYLLDFPSRCKFSSRYELLQFINCTLTNLRSLLRLKAGTIVSVRMQVRDLIKKLRKFRDLIKSTEKVLFFGFDIRDCASRIACLSMLYWVDQMEEEMANRMKAILTNLLHMVDSYFPEVQGLCVKASLASKLSSNISIILWSFNTSKIGEAVASCLDLLLPIGFIEILRQDLIFLIAFLMHLHPKYWNLVVIKARALAAEIPSLICSLTATEVNKETEERNLLIRDFQDKINNVKMEVRELLFSTPNPELLKSHFPLQELYFQIKSHFPATNALGFIDFFLENLGTLKETSISEANFLPFIRDQLVTLHRELLSVRPHLKNMQDIQNEFVELKDLWTNLTDVVYIAEHVIDSCQVLDLPIWYNVLCLSDVIEKVKLTKRQIKMIMDNPVYTHGILNAKVNSGSVHLGQAYTSRLDDTVVGFEDEAETIIDRLTRDSMELEIVSIVGMPGQGKTTLARKVYNSDPIQHHFRKYAWCFVTQVYEVKRLLLDIFRGVTTVLDDRIHEMRKEDLEEKICQCLKRQRYLIVMDDIWDIQVWNAVKMSFPDDKNGSRILFTGRNELVCNPHHLRPLNDTEGMKLFWQKIFPKGSRSGLYFLLGAEVVSKFCKGLPLAIVVLAGVLKGELAGVLESLSYDLKQWWQIVQTLNSKIASEGCRDMIELSYKSLPDFLKPCFLYLGAVGKNKVVKVHKLIQLWIAEGFVRKSATKSQEELGREYLDDLVGRSLVIVDKRSFSSGEIKECRIHDILLEFCLAKAEEERFVHFSEAHNHSSGPIIYDQYRLCIFNEWIFSSSTKTIGPNVRSLLVSLGGSWFKYPYVSTDCFFIMLEFLRVLDLETVDFGSSFPEEIMLLTCLRYLSIMSRVKVVPSSIGNLCNLETFRVVSRYPSDIVQLPRTIWNVKTLRNVDFFNGVTIVLDNNGVPQLGNLDRISTLYLPHLEGVEKLLGGFPRVQTLKLEFSKSWNRKGQCNQLQVLHSLNKLESLTLLYSGHGKHTCALQLPTTLKKLTLSEFGRPWSDMSTIGELPNLEVLKLLDSAIEEETWDVEDVKFLRLKYLKLSRLRISHWKACTSSFPCLERLVVRNCPYLVEFPSCVEDVVTLEMIQVHGCLKSLGTSAESIRSVKQDMGSDKFEVLISGVGDYRRFDTSFPRSYRRFSGLYDAEIFSAFNRRQRRFSGLYDTEIFPAFNRRHRRFSGLYDTEIFSAFNRRQRRFTDLTSASNMWSWDEIVAGETLEGDRGNRERRFSGLYDTEIFSAFNRRQRRFTDLTSASNMWSWDEIVAGETLEGDRGDRERCFSGLYDTEIFSAFNRRHRRFTDLTSAFNTWSWDEIVAGETLKDDRGDRERRLACVKRRDVPSVQGARRTNLLLKHNFQPRQAIMSRHTKEELKMDA